jgi:uncharacterized protein
MLALDTSLLAYAVNRHAPEHARATRVVEQVADGALPWALPWPVLHEFLRLVTHRHAAPRALSPADARAFVEALLASRSVRLLGPGEGHAAALAELLGALPAGAGVPAGLEVAAVLREHGVRELLTADAGMRRFAFLSVRDPVHGPPWTPSETPARRYRVLKPPPARG